MPATAVEVDFEVETGASITRILRVVDETTGVVSDVTTGYKARGQIRTRTGRAGTTTASTLVLDLTEGNGRVMVEDYQGNRCVKLHLTAIDTALCNPNNVNRLTLFFAIELFDDANPTTNVEAFVKGRFVFTYGTARSA